MFRFKISVIKKLLTNIHWTTNSLPYTNSIKKGISTIVLIENIPKDPVEMFCNVLKEFKTANPDAPFIPMNISTVDEEFGSLNRTMVYRGLVDDHIVFVTEKNSVKYENIVKDPRTAVCFLFTINEKNGNSSIWQVRLMGNSEELSPNQISNLWNEEPDYAKIRYRVNVSGKPVDFDKQKEAYDKLAKEYENGQDSLPQTDTYTAFKIVPKVWDFYMTVPNCVADRVQYRKETSDNGKWSIMHVAS